MTKLGNVLGHSNFSDLQHIFQWPPAHDTSGSSTFFLVHNGLIIIVIIILQQKLWFSSYKNKESIQGFKKKSCYTIVVSYILIFYFEQYQPK